MALYRQIFIEFWKDPKVTEEMSAEDRYALLYLLTNPHTTQIGIYQITKRQIAFDLGYSTESVGAIIDRFERLLGLIRYNPETRELAIKNWGKYNLKRGGKPVLDCIRKELEKVKDRTLIEYVADSIPNESIKELFLRNVHVTSTISEQEEEQEQQHTEKVVVDNEIERSLAIVELKKAYNQLGDKDIKKIADTLSAKRESYDLGYLKEKIEISKKQPNLRNIVGFLIKAIIEDFNNESITNFEKNNSNDQLNPKIHNFTGSDSYKKYSEEELERIILENQKNKFN